MVRMPLSVVFITFIFFIKFIAVIIFSNLYEFPDPYFVYGHDESFMHNQAKALLDYINSHGIWYTFFNSQNIIGSYNTIWPLIMALIFKINHNILYVLIFKIIVFSVSSFHFFNISYFFTKSKKFAYLSLIFISIYPPLNIYMFSILRDDFIFSLFTSSIYFALLFREKKAFKHILFSIIFLLIMLPLRIHVGFVLMLFLLKLSMNKTNRINIILTLSAILILCSSFIYNFINIGYYYLSTNFSLIQFSLKNILFDLLKFLLGPLPWQITEGHHQYNTLWYYFALFLIIISFILFPDEIIRSIKKYYHYLFFLFIYFFAYHISNQFVDAIGPRQFAVIAPFLFIFIYGDLIKKLRF